MINFKDNQIILGSSLDYYNQWESPVCIICDGPYGINGYEGDLNDTVSMKDFYEPHIKLWSQNCSSQTTLWFWNTEIGWATIHSILEKYGWIYKSCNIWDKGISHIAGNCNGKTMRKFPVVTEVCVQYIRKEVFELKNGQEQSLQEWLRSEWSRTGLSLAHANIACGVKNAASRKYLTKDNLWYAPPSEEFIKLVDYANTHGKKENRPYFSTNGQSPMTSGQWNRLRAKFNFEYGVTNVWNVPALKPSQRIKIDKKFHPSEKPVLLMERIIKASSDEGDRIWEPFGGTGVGSWCAWHLGRKFSCAEINPDYFEFIKKRFEI